MQTYQGYFVEQDKFVSSGVMRIPLHKRAIVTILDEPPKNEVVSDNVSRRLKEFDEINAMIDAAIDEENHQLAAFDELVAAIHASDEEVPEFERADLYREVEL
ncbi:MAG: hypothetical protein FWG71_11120 [Synergistaceae bacterium]|nr:hypothetical protein [Synergistaceae bacterium]